VLGDAASLPFLADTFDTVMLLDVVEHLSRPEDAFAGACRVLRKGGRLLITVPFSYPMHDQPHDYQRFTEHGLRYRLGQAGFDCVEVREVGDAISASASNLAIAIAKGSLDAVSKRGWKLIALLCVPPLVLATNLLGWLWGRILPAKALMPAGYYIEAVRR
jgi:SAM-dependent methyltransferase